MRHDSEPLSGWTCMMRGIAVFLLMVMTCPGHHASLLAQSDPNREEDDQGGMDDVFGRKNLWPRFTLHGFADVTAGIDRSNSGGQESSFDNSFGIGALDLFITSRLARNISFLGETVFEQDSDGHSVVDVERLVLKYTLSDQFWISLGRHHTSLGYWNENYHHGLFLQPVVQRPEALKFEDDGGILPVHSVGVALGGRWFRGSWGLDYAANIGNGRGAAVDEIQNGSDLNDSKAFTTRLTVSRERIGRILFGATLHLDTIPPNPAITGREGEMRERIAGGHFTYRDDRLEVLSEYYDVLHVDVATDERYHHPAYYAIGIWRQFKWKPYVGYDRLNLDEADLFYAGSVIDVKRALVGVRWDLQTFNAIKFEYRHDNRDGVGVHGLYMQASFTF